MADPYVDRKAVNASYRPKSNQMSPGLRRARAPFFLRNAVTGVVLGGFAVGVWAYSLGAVKQDDFTDVDEEARALKRTSASAPVSGAVPTVTVGKSSAVGPSGTTPLLPPDRVPAVISIRPTEEAKEEVESRTVAARGFAALVDLRMPQLLDPQTKTFVWGAPPVENMGRMRERVEWPKRHT